MIYVFWQINWLLGENKHGLNWKTMFFLLLLLHVFLPKYRRDEAVLWLCKVTENINNIVSNTVTTIWNSCFIKKFCIYFLQPASDEDDNEDDDVMVGCLGFVATSSHPSDVPQLHLSPSKAAAGRGGFIFRKNYSSTHKMYTCFFKRDGPSVLLTDSIYVVSFKSNLYSQ